MVEEEKALEELYRITKKYLILLEPAYEFANTKAKARMDKNGYITKLYPTALKLGFKSSSIVFSIIRGTI